NRLCRGPVGPRIERFFCDTVSVGGDGHDGNLFKSGAPAQFLYHFNAVEVGHVDISYDQVRLLCIGDNKPVIAVFGGRNIERLQLKQFCHHVASVVAVIDNQYFVKHRSAPSQTSSWPPCALRRAGTHHHDTTQVRVTESTLAPSMQAGAGYFVARYSQAI